jgi:hypothetical protein
LKDYDPATGVIPPWLPGEFHDKWVEALTAGRRPDIGYNRGGFYIRSWAQRDVPKSDRREQGNAQQPGGEQGDEPPGRQPKQDPGGGSKPGGVFVIHPFVRIDPLTLPPRQWLYGKHYQRRTVSATIAPGGTGKSSLNLAEAIAMATARNLLGEQPEERLRVWYHNGEDNRLEIDRRILAVCQQYDIPQEELEGWLFVTTGAEIPLRVAQGYSNLELDAPLIRRIRECMGDLEIAVASLDPLITLHGVPKGDNGKMYRVVRIFADMGEELDASFEVAHHTRKGPPGGGAYEYTADDMRGASAVRDAVRAARILNHMTAHEAEDVSIPEYDRGTYFRVDRAKGNYSRAAKLATWRRFVSVELPNEDEVGVVVPWEFPGQGQQTPEKAAADQKAEEVVLRLLDKLTARGSRVSESRAPGVFADEPEARKAQVGKAAIKAAIGRLLDAGRVRVEEGSRADRATRYLVPWQGAPKPPRAVEA